MFGYVKPYVPALTVAEYEAYKGAYCGLCRTMGHLTGQISRLTLNYDFAFLAIFLTARLRRSYKNRMSGKKTGSRVYRIILWLIDALAELEALTDSDLERDALSDALALSDNDWLRDSEV